MYQNKPKTLNKTYPLYNTMTWYSWTHKKYYCTMDHCIPDSGWDLKEAFKTQAHFIAHMKNVHHIDFAPCKIPEEPHDSCFITD